MTTTTREFLEVLAKVLLRCGLLGFALLFIWLGAILFLTPTIHQWHGAMFGLTAHELDVILYCAMGLFKLLVLAFFWIPWLAIKWVLKTGKA